MSIVGISIKRPVVLVMIFLAGIIFGIISLDRMDIDLLPSIQYPEISVITLYMGASPKEVESLITKPIEEALGGVSGVKRVRSESIEGASLVTAAFNWGADMDYAAIRIKEKADLVRGILPQEAEKSIVARFDPNSLPVMGIAVKGKDYDIHKLRRLLKLKIKPEFDRIEGVGSVKIAGGMIREIQVLVDLASLYAYGLSIYDVIERINMSNYNFPAGSVNKGSREYLIRTIGEFKSLKDIEEVLIKKSEAGRSIYVKDIARVVDGFKDRDSVSFYNGSESLGVSVIKESGRNSVKVCSKVRELVRELNRRYGDKAEFSICYDGSRYIRNAIDNVTGSAVLGGFIAFFVILFFLKDLKTSLIITIVLPASILITLLFMYVRGVNINMMSLGGLALGVGMLVDSGIVVIESIQKKIDAGMNMSVAGREGASEVMGPLLSSTLTSVVVFVPIIFVRGIAGAIFSELAFTVSVSLLVSYIISITLVPSLFVLLAGGVKENSFWALRRVPGILKIGSFIEKKSGPILPLAEKAYGRVIAGNLEKFKMALIFGAVSVAAGLILFVFIDSGFLPESDSGALTVRVSAPRGTPLKDTGEIMLYIDKAVSKKEYAENRFIDAGYNPGEISEYFGRDRNRSVAEMLVTLKEDRGITTEEAMHDLAGSIKLPDDITLEIFSDEREFAGIVNVSASSLTVDVVGDDFEDIDRAVEVLINEFKKIGSIENPMPLVEKGKPEARIDIDRQKLSSFGIDLSRAAGHIRASVRGEQAGKFYEADDQTDISVRLREEDRRDIERLGSMLVKSGKDSNIPLSAFAEVKLQKGYNKITRNEQRRAFRIKADMPEGASRDSAVKAVENILNTVKLPSGVKAVMSSEMKEIESSVNELIFSLFLSALLIYMILASQFESLTRPFVVMLSVPLTVSGVSLALFISGNTLNIISVMGMVMLSGIVVNNSIVLLECIRSYRNSMRLRDAVLSGCRERLRPIMMTTATTVLGLLPLAFGIKDGGEMQSPLAVTVIGGLLASTVLTLVLLPVYYYRIESRKVSVSEEGLYAPEVFNKEFREITGE